MCTCVANSLFSLISCSEADPGFVVVGRGANIIIKTHETV